MNILKLEASILRFSVLFQVRTKIQHTGVTYRWYNIIRPLLISGFTGITVVGLDILYGRVSFIVDLPFGILSDEQKEGYRSPFST